MKILKFQSEADRPAAVGVAKLDGSAWDRQLAFYDEECDPEFEIERPHGCGKIYEFLIEQKFRTGLRTLGRDLAGRSVLEVCCGSGMMAEKLARAGARVTGVDFSPAAVGRARERARRYRFDADFAEGDAEHLQFADRTFDVVMVHDGLHHLDHPEQAIREMTRVARSAVLILDPAEALFTRLAVRLGLAVDVEDAGNEVKRLVPEKVASVLNEQGFSQIGWRRTLMYYQHRPSGYFAWFETPPMFFLFRALFGAANLLLGRWGNKLTLAAVRNNC